MLPDYLKKNYPTGNAYTLVAKIGEIDDIWDKLISAFGNTNLLLQNKLSSLEKFSSLDKSRDDEKFLFALSGILNVMADLKKLADTYGLEGDLYHGGGLHRILNIIGEFRERKFLKSLVKESGVLDNKQKWSKLGEFLENERVEREMFVINEKTKLSLNIDSKGKSKKRVMILEFPIKDLWPKTKGVKTVIFVIKIVSMLKVLIKMGQRSLSILRVRISCK